MICIYTENQGHGDVNRVGEIRADEGPMNPGRNHGDQVQSELLSDIDGCFLRQRLRHNVRPSERLRAADELHVGPRVLVDDAVGVRGGAEGGGGDAARVHHAPHRFGVGAGLQNALQPGSDPFDLHFLGFLLGEVQRVSHVEHAAASFYRRRERLRLVEVGVEDLQPLRRAGEVGDVADVPLPLWGI